MAIAEEDAIQSEVTPDDLLETQISAVDDYFDSTCSTPYVSAPSSPGRPTITTVPCFFSAPASPTRFFSSPSFSHPSSSSSLLQPLDSSVDFEFSARLQGAGSDSVSMPPATMISADELFFNGQIRPMRSPWKPIELVVPDPSARPDPAFPAGNEERGIGRELRSKSRSLRRRARSLSPLRDAGPVWLDFVPETNDEGEEGREGEQKTVDPSPEVGVVRRSSRRWMSIKEFLYRSKSEGRGYVKEKLSWSALSFSPSKEKKATAPVTRVDKKKASSRDGERKLHTTTPSPHELHYTAKRAQAEEMKKKTYLPYRQGLLGCLGFSSRSYSMVNGLAKTLHHHQIPSK